MTVIDVSTFRHFSKFLRQYLYCTVYTIEYCIVYTAYILLYSTNCLYSLQVLPKANCLLLKQSMKCLLSTFLPLPLSTAPYIRIVCACRSIGLLPTISCIYCTTFIPAWQSFGKVLASHTATVFGGHSVVSLLYSSIKTNLLSLIACKD